MNYICPHCHKDFEANSIWVCDNDCTTLYCLHCDGEVYIYAGELLEGHDPMCGDLEYSF